MADSTRVRPVRGDDASRLAGLLAVMGYDVETDLVAERLTGLDDDHEVAVAELDGEVVGWVHVYVDRTLYGPDIAQLGGLAVDPDFHGRGIGSRLLETVETWARERGCVGMWIRSGSDRTQAHDFYRTHGYRDVKRQVVLVKSLVDDVDDPRLAPALGPTRAGPEEGCVFCDEVSRDEEILVYRDEHTMAFPPLQQRTTNRGHMLVATRAHVRDLDDLPDHLAAPVLTTVQRISSAVREATGATGTTIRQNNGPPGQDVFHLHFHVIPRFDHADDLKGRWDAITRQEQSETAKYLRPPDVGALNSHAGPHAPLGVPSACQPCEVASRGSGSWGNSASVSSTVAAQSGSSHSQTKLRTNVSAHRSTRAARGRPGTAPGSPRSPHAAAASVQSGSGRGDPRPEGRRGPSRRPPASPSPHYEASTPPRRVRGGRSSRGVTDDGLR